MINRENKVDEMLQQLDGLFEKDPHRFEDLRRDIIDTTISCYPERFQQRAQGIQFTLDCELDRIKNPVVRMNRMVEIFWQKVAEFQTVVNDPRSASAEQELKNKAAKVIQLFQSDDR